MSRIDSNTAAWRRNHASRNANKHARLQKQSHPLSRSDTAYTEKSATGYALRGFLRAVYKFKKPDKEKRKDSY